MAAKRRLTPWMHGVWLRAGGRHLRLRRLRPNHLVDPLEEWLVGAPGEDAASTIAANYRRLVDAYEESPR